MLYSSLWYVCDSGLHKLYSQKMPIWLSYVLLIVLQWFCHRPSLSFVPLERCHQRWKSDFTHNSAYRFCSRNTEYQWNQGNSKSRSVYLHSFCLIFCFTNPSFTATNNFCSTEQQHFFWYVCVFTAKFVSFSLWLCRVTHVVPCITDATMFC